MTVELSDTVKYIGRRAFMDCESIDTIYFPDSLKWIDDDAFRGCYRNRLFLSN